MKIVRVFFLTVSMVFGVLIHQSQGDDQIDYAGIESLVQQDKNEEAKSKLDALIKQYPDNAKLKEMRTSLNDSSPNSGASQSGQSRETASQPTSPQPVALDPAANRQLFKIMADGNDALAQQDADARVGAWREFLADSDPFVQAHPDQFNVWLLRAQAALELDLSRPGWEAGKNLTRLGAYNSQDATVANVMGHLDKKGWINVDYTTISASQNADSQKQAEKIKAKIDELQKKLLINEKNKRRTQDSIDVLQQRIDSYNARGWDFSLWLKNRNICYDDLSVYNKNIDTIQESIADEKHRLQTINGKTPTQ